MPSPSPSGSRYFVTFIDDYSRNTWTYFLKAKLEVFHGFKNFKAMVENGIGDKITTLRIDRGGEYTSKEFDRFYEEIDIINQKTHAYTLHQNGLQRGKTRYCWNEQEA